MPQNCCTLHKFTDSDQFPVRLKEEKTTEFCEFIQNTIHMRAKCPNLLENPNDINVFVYLFGGQGTRYLTTVCGEFVTFIPEKFVLANMKWFPVIATKHTHQTKSLTLIGKTKLSLALLLLMNYYERYMKEHRHFVLHYHMTIPKEAQCLLFMLLNTYDFNLQPTIGRQLTSITLCTDDVKLKTMTTLNPLLSFHHHEKITLRNFFPEFLTLHSNKRLPTTEEITESWNQAIASLILMENWTSQNYSLQLLQIPIYNNASSMNSQEQQIHQQISIQNSS